jgi:hypothetical protein
LQCLDAVALFEKWPEISINQIDLSFKFSEELQSDVPFFEGHKLVIDLEFGELYDGFGMIIYS